MMSQWYERITGLRKGIAGRLIHEGADILDDRMIDYDSLEEESFYAFNGISEIPELEELSFYVHLEDSDVDNEILSETDEDNQKEIEKEEEDEIPNLNSQAASRIAKQSAQISELTEELTRARNLNSELQRRNEKYRMKLLDRVDNTKVIMESEVGEKINQTIKGMDTLSVKIEEEFGKLVSRIYEIENEVKVVMKWVTDNKTEQEIGRLKEMEAVQKSIRRLNQNVERGEEKIGELEKMIAEKDEQMNELEIKMSEKESTIWSLSKTLESVITTATVKISKA